MDIPEPDAPKANEVFVAVEYAPINQSEQLNDTCFALECAYTNCYFFCMR